MLSVVLFYAIGPSGIALATSLTGWLNVVLLAWSLRRRGEFILDGRFRLAFLGIVLASIAMGLGLWWATSMFYPYFDPTYGLLVQVIALAALIAFGLVLYFAIGTLTGALKPRTFVKELLGR